MHSLHTTIAGLLLGLLLAHVPPNHSGNPGKTVPVGKIGGEIEKITLAFRRGNFMVRRYRARLNVGALGPRALVVFGSGCGGWTNGEERVCRKFQNEGIDVLGVDFQVYANADYDQSTLGGDMTTLVQYGLAPYGGNPPPVIIGGWSTGAEQAVAIAADPQLPPQVTGLLLIAPGANGEYGTYANNYINVFIPADREFKLSAFAPHLNKLRIAQWHAEFDPLDSMTWLNKQKGSHRVYNFPNAIHDFNGASDAFLTGLSSSVAWILGEKRPLAPSLGIWINQKS